MCLFLNVQRQNCVALATTDMQWHTIYTHADTHTHTDRQTDRQTDIRKDIQLQRQHVSQSVIATGCTKLLDVVRLSGLKTKTQRFCHKQLDVQNTFTGSHSNKSA